MDAESREQGGQGRTAPTGRPRPRSALPEILWPPVPDPEGGTLLGLLWYLEGSQWLSAERLREMQLGQLRRMVGFAVEQVPLYRKRFARAGVTSAADLTPENWTRLPLLRRVEVQQQARLLMAGWVPTGHGPVGGTSTSGSTGVPLQVRTTRLTRLFWSLFTLRDHLWHGRDLSGTFAAIRYTAKDAATYPEGRLMESWGKPVGTVFETGRGALLNIRTDVTAQLEWLDRQQPAYLLTYPSNARALGELLRRQGRTLPSLRELQLFGEVVDAEVRAGCEMDWGVRVSDMYSANEVGYIALQCPERSHYHVQSENVLVEVLDADGRPCQPGQVGRVVLTTLHNFAMPLIRYEIGDHAEVGEPCPCGRGLPVLNRILGRTRNMVVLPSGERRWPLFGNALRKAVPAVRQQRLIQHSRERIEACLVVARPLQPAEEETLRAKLVESLGHPFEIVFSYHDRLEATAAGKFEDFRSLVL